MKSFIKNLNLKTKIFYIIATMLCVVGFVFGVITGGGGILLDNKKNSQAATFETYVDIYPFQDKMNVYLFFDTEHLNIIARFAGEFLQPNRPIPNKALDNLTEDQQQGVASIELSIDETKINFSVSGGTTIIDVMTLRIDFDTSLIIPPEQMEFYEEVENAWAGMMRQFGAFPTLEYKNGGFLLKLSLDLSMATSIGSDEFVNVLREFFYEIFNMGMPLIKFELGLDTKNIDIGIFTDGEESTMGGSVQVTYPKSLGEVAENTTETLEESKTLSVVSDLGEQYPFIISVKPNPGYEVETLVGDSDVNITSVDNLKDSYKIFFISNDAKWEGEGNKGSPYRIFNKNQLKRLATTVNNGLNFANAYFEQTMDIDVLNEEWKPIGQNYSDVRYAFSGHYNGNEFQIKNIAINNLSEGLSGGLFGVIEGAEIENVVLNVGGFNVSNVASDVGSIAGIADNSTICNCVSNINILSGKTAGGIVGTGNGVNILDCHYSGEVICRGGDAAGGIAGNFTENSQMTLCVFNGTVTADGGTKYCGGLYGVSKFGNAKAINCTAKANLTGSDVIGGLVGSVGSGDVVQNCSLYGKIVFNGSDLSKAGTLAGVVADSEGEIFTACSFNGTSVAALNLLGDSASGTTLNTCWAKCNDSIQVSSNILDNSIDWEKYWGIITGMNDGLPLQKELYWLTVVEDSTADDLNRALPNAKVFQAA